MTSRREGAGILAGLGLLLVTAEVAPAQSGAPPRLTVDAADAPQQILHARLTLPVRPGPMTLVYPRWLPGDHGPSGPVSDLVGLRFEALGRPLSWERDSTDWYAFRLRVPEGATEITAHYDFVWPASSDGNVDDAVSARLAILNWNTVVLYPEGSPMTGLEVAPRLRVPAGWSVASALEQKSSSGGLIAFETVTLERLVDSPVLLGAHMKEFALAPDVSPPHRIALAADSPEALRVSPELERAWHRLVDETLALFGRAPYRHYTFLVALSDQVSHFGLEHQESSQNRMPERSLTDDSARLSNATLLPHEIVHAWNGKYRRPWDMVKDDFQAPLTTELLWIYEGLTEYYGWVLAARAGLLEPDEARDELARVAAVQEARPGRRWRSLRDVAVSAHLVYTAPAEWTGIRRGPDFYSEGQLLWLEVDAMIRERTKDKRSLDDFARAFFGGERAGPPAVVPYRLEDVIATLNRVAPFDWAGFFRERVDRPTEHAPLGGLRASGFALAFRDSLTPYLEAVESAYELMDLRHSLGLRVDDEGSVSDVLPGSPAFDAGFGPGMTIVAVNGRRMSGEHLREALRAARDSSLGGLELLVENGEFFRSARIDYRGGDRQPWLERRKGTRDRLKDILAPRAKARNINSLKGLQGRSRP